MIQVPDESNAESMKFDSDIVYQISYISDESNEMLWMNQILCDSHKTN